MNESLIAVTATVILLVGTYTYMKNIDNRHNITYTLHNTHYEH